MGKISSIFKFWVIPAASLGILLMEPHQAAANVTISLDAGYLYGASTTKPPTSPPTPTTALPTGSLLLLVASASGTTFGGPTAGSYTSNGDVIIGAAAFNTNNGTGGTGGFGGETTNPITITTANYPTNLTTSNYVALYWFPGITYSQYTAGTTTPSAGMAFGAYNPEAINITSQTTLNPDGGSNWTLPPNPSTNYLLDFFTTTDSGKDSDSDGVARFTVVPEPSSYVAGLLCTVVVAFTGMRRVRHRRA